MLAAALALLALWTAADRAGGAEAPARPAPAVTSAPAHFGTAAYARLAAAREVYWAIVRAGGWPRLTATTKLALGSQAPEILTLRTRLQLTGDLATELLAGDIFDEALDEAVRRFQRRHGLEVDGVVGPRTRAALNVSAGDRLAAIDLNLRRIAALRLVGVGTQLVLNIAGAELVVLEDGVPVATHRAIVGRRDWQTPLLYGVITRLDLNPAWTVPPRIVREELLPRVRRDPGYLSREGIRALRDPRTGEIVYRQPPGPENPLGVVRFFFPNTHSVFLHDTPNQALFQRAERTFSHGCVRVEHALDLALYILRNEGAWPAERVAAVLSAGTSESVTLTRPVPIALTYLTAWVDEAGELQFRPDVYRRDQRQIVELSAHQIPCGA